MPHNGDHTHPKGCHPTSTAFTNYRSAFIGKWHVGGHGAEGYQPRDQGFEEIAYFDAGGSPFFNWKSLWDRKTKNDPAMPQKELLWGKSGGASGDDYLTDDLTTQADRFIRNHHQKRPHQPFLLYFCHFAVHSPIHIVRAHVSPSRNTVAFHVVPYAIYGRDLELAQLRSLFGATPSVRLDFK